jgi:MFS family permease
MSLPVESAPALLSAAERRWSLAAAISSATVFGIGIGLGGPLLSLVLEARGTDATLNGLSAASTFIGVIVGPLITPGAVRRIGIRRFLLGCLALDIALFMLMKLTDSIAAWFVLRLMLGIVGSGIFTTTEAWINLLAGDAGRGRILGLYVASLSAGFGAGPLLLSVTGIAGWTPFIAASLIVAVAALPLLAAGNGTYDLGRPPARGPLAVFAEQPLLMLTVALFGLYEAAVMTLLPIWGVRIGLGDRLGAATVSAIYFGAIALQVPIGWLSDKLERRLVLRLCAASGLVGAALLPLASGTMPALFTLLFLGRLHHSDLPDRAHLGRRALSWRRAGQRQRGDRHRLWAGCADRAGAGRCRARCVEPAGAAGAAGTALPPARRDDLGPPRLTRPIGIGRPGPAIGGWPGRPPLAPAATALFGRAPVRRMARGMPETATLLLYGAGLATPPRCCTDRLSASPGARSGAAAPELAQSPTGRFHLPANHGLPKNDICCYLCCK